jgi:hypothetical protein
MGSMKLRSLRIVKYLGASNEGVTVDFHPHCTAFCGPNNSGKTTICRRYRFFQRLCDLDLLDRPARQP